MDSLLNAISKFCFSQNPDATFWIGLSGGLDSSVLLHLLARAREQRFFKLRAVYIHHGLSANADRWQSHCKDSCQALKIDFNTHALTLPAPSKDSPEALARQMRYQQFSILLEENDILLTAHHQDDQAETVLLQLLRGAGPKGLSAMPRLKAFGKGFHARPLLDFSRAQLERYAEKNKLNWVDDESNKNAQFTRNFLRKEIVPLLKKRWPTVTETLARAADHCAATQTLIDEVLGIELNKIRGNIKNTLSVSGLLTLNLSTQRFILRAWIQELNFPLPSSVKLNEIQTSLLNAQRDKLPCVSWAQVELRRFQDALYLMGKPAPHDGTQVFRWNMIDPLVLPSLGVLSSRYTSNSQYQKEENISVRFRQGGEVMRLRGKHRTLKNLFQEWKIPPWERDRIPLIYQGDKLVAVGDWEIGDDFWIKEKKNFLSFNWVKQS